MFGYEIFNILITVIIINNWRKCNLLGLRYFLVIVPGESYLNFKIKNPHIVDYLDLLNFESLVNLLFLESKVKIRSHTAPDQGVVPLSECAAPCCWLKIRQS